MAARDYFFNRPLKRWIVSTLFNTVPVERSGRNMRSLGICRQMLASGSSILIYPEGTRSETGRMRAFRPGIGILAVELDYPIIPVHVSGTFESMPRGRRIPRRSRVVVRCGRPLGRREILAALEPRKSLESSSHENGRAQNRYRHAAALIGAAVARLGDGA